MPMRLLSALFCLCIPGTLLADTLFLKNGDRISGEILRKESDKIMIKTSYAGEIGVAWSDILKLESGKALDIILQDDTRIQASVTATDNDRLSLKNAQIAQPVEVDVAQVKFINASPDVSGNGIKVKGRVNSGIDISSGNTDSEQYNLDTEVVMRTKVNRFTVGANLYRASESDVDTEDKSMGYLKYDHFLSSKRYVYGNTSVSRDKFKDLKLKSSIGVGYGHQFFESDERNLALEGGLNLVNDDFYAASDESYTAARWAIKYDELFFQKRVQFFHNHEGLIDVNDTNNLNINTQTGFRFPLFAGMNATLQANLDWDRSPSPGAKNTDRKYLFNVGYSW